MLQHRSCVHILLTRSICTSSVLFKQPPHDRQRRRRKLVPPMHHLPFVDEDPQKNLKFEHLFPKQIQGSWGSTDEKTKGKFFKIGEVLKAQPTLFEKLKELYYHEENMWYHRIDVPFESTGTLDFTQYITRTNIRSMDEIKSLYGSASTFNTKYIQNWAQEFLNFYPLQSIESQNSRQEFLASFAECLQACLTTHATDSYLRRRKTQSDVGGKVETFLKRSGFAELYDTERLKRESLSEGLWEPTEEAILDAQQLLRFRIRSKLAWHIRSNSPLPPFVSLSDKVCFEDRLPPDGKLYRPEVFGLDPIDHYDFSCLPYVNNVYSPEYIRSVAGFWPPSPFLPNPVSAEPCQFGLLGVLDVTPSSEQLLLLQPCGDGGTSTEALERDAISNGLLTAFAWTSAMAYNQGFTLYNELDRPFTVQLLLFDANAATWQLLAYQLNTLSGLWKAPDAGDPFNLAWHSPRLPLFDSSRRHVNPETIDLLARAILLPPTEAEEEETSTESHLIPDSNQELTTAAAAAVSSGGAELTASEEAALRIAEGDEQARLNHPTRCLPHPKPHPNEVFFYKLTQKADLLAEMREAMPAFGGPTSTSPEAPSVIPKETKELLRLFRQWKRNSTVQNKVLRRPPRWR